MVATRLNLSHEQFRFGKEGIRCHKSVQMPGADGAFKKSQIRAAFKRQRG
jgi:hypothetical protein